MKTQIHKIPIKLFADPKRVITLPSLNPGLGRVKRIYQRVADLSDGEAEKILSETNEEFGHRHKNIESVYLNNYSYFEVTLHFTSTITIITITSITRTTTHVGGHDEEPLSHADKSADLHWFYNAFVKSNFLEQMRFRDVLWSEFYLIGVPQSSQMGTKRDPRGTNNETKMTSFLFPVRAFAQGSLCVRLPPFRGWSSKDSADFRSTKTMLKTFFSW